MYTYKLYLFVTYLLTFRWAFCTTGLEATTENRNVIVDLSNLKEHGSVTENNYTFKLKETTFTTPTNKVVDKVVYDGTDVWASSSNPNKVLTKIVVTQRNNIPQLLHLVVSTSATAEVPENKYYKKEKTQFTDLLQQNYTEEDKKLKKPGKNYLNEWYPMNFAKPDVHSGTAKEQKDLDDGVWKYTYTLSDGFVSVVKDGNDTIWTHSNEKLTSVKKLDFGNGNYLLTLGFRTVEKYFHKSGADTTWQALNDKSAFLTKATNFKSNYFSQKIEYDLSGPPSTTHFYIKRNHNRNYNQLTLNVLPQFYLGNVKYKETSLWSGEKDTRVLYLKLDLLYHEVKTLQVFYSVASTGPFPNKKVTYFFKDTDGAFKQVSTKDEFSVHEKKVKAAIDKTTPFVYNEAWPSQPKPMDLKNFNLGDFEVSKEDLTKGVTKLTLKPKAVSPMNGLNFNGVVLWPTVRPEVTKPSVKEVVIISKDTLPQLVHLKAAAVQVPARGSTGTTTNPTEFNLYFQKVGENYNKVKDAPAFELLKSNLVSGAQKPDLFFHLDLNLEKQNNSVYSLNKKYEDGVTIKVVEPKPHIRVTKLFSYSHDIWVRPLSRVDHVLKKYELYSHGNKKLLKLYIGEFDDRHHITHEYFEKRDSNVAWTSFYKANFDDKLRDLKSTATSTPLELDVSASPSTTDYRVQVNSLSGNKTKLVLEPVEGKKVIKVQHGTHVFFTSVDNNRAYKVELYLEDYSVRFVKVFVWKDVPHGAALLTEEKRFKDVTASATTWGNANFDAKLREFETTTSTVPFTYSETWVLPSMTFDPKTSHSFYFPSTDHTEGLVTTTTYTPTLGTVVHKVLYDRSKVWPNTADAAGDTTKKLVELKVVSKNDIVQLLHLKIAPVSDPNTTEDLYYKKVMDTYEKLEGVDKFNELKNTLTQADKYVDDNVKLDLSSTEETSTKLFEKETTLEDGVEKTVVVVKAGKLFQVSASPPLWTSRDGEYVTRLERYVLDLTQFLVLHITNRDGSAETKYFEKPIQTTPTPPEPGRDPSRPEATQTTEEQRRQTEHQQESQVPRQDPPPAPTTPSFSALDGSNAFFIKLNQAKARVEHDEVPLDVSAYTNNEKFEVKRVTEGTATLFKVYPKKAHWVTSLVNTSGVNLWTKEAQGERLVEAFLYVHDTKLKFVKAVVWPDNRTDASHDKLFHFKLENGALVSKTPEVFKKELEALTKVPPTPLSTEKYPPPEPTPYFFHKLYLSDTVDTNLFDFTESTAGAYKLKNYAVKQHKFVNAVETQHGLLWKSDDNLDHMKSTQFAVKENSALARLTLSVNSQPTDLYFKFENDRWDVLDTNTYLDLYAKAGLPYS